MSIDRFHPAQLDKTTLAGIQQLEQELDVVLVAVDPDPAPAQLGDKALQQLQAMEKKTGKVLLAYSH